MERFVVSIDRQENRSINRTISVRSHTNDVIERFSVSVRRENVLHVSYAGERWSRNYFV